MDNGLSSFAPLEEAKKFDALLGSPRLLCIKKIISGNLGSSTKKRKGGKGDPASSGQ